MRIPKFFHIFILSAFLINSLLLGQEPEQLRKQDISKIMEQIFSEHLGEKQINDEILKHAFKIYIDQFDPDRTYLLQNEIKPFLQLTPNQMQDLISQYKASDFSSFERLNKVIQKSIMRSRQIRKELLKNPEEIFNAADQLKTTKDNEWLDPDLNRLFATSTQQLKGRIKQEMVNFIQAEQKRYGKEQVLRYKSKILILYNNALNDIEDNYLYQKNDGQSFTQAQKENAFTLHVLKSLASSLDAHTAFYSNAEAYDLRVRLEKEFEGIGVALQQTPEGIVISTLIKGGPAFKSGLVLARDRIVKVDGKPIAGESLSNVVEMMHGSKGSDIELVLARKVKDGDKQIEKEVTVTLKREPIAMEGDRINVKYEQFGNGLIGMITLHSFYQGADGIGSVNDLRKAILDLDKKGNLRGLILDLRENSGGFLGQAVKVAGLFISNGVVVISKYSDGEERIYRDMDGNPVYNGPLIILTSKATASAAEIVAQALQDYGVALIVGDDHTYGKGTIQSQTITGPESASSFFKVTIGKYYTVSGKTPQLQGVEADIVAPGPFSEEHIGERYLDHPLKPDSISPDYSDDLQDINPSLRAWYMKYYTPTIQHKIATWRNMLPTLKKNSAYRIEHNKNYQMFLKQLNGDEVNMELFKNSGENDDIQDGQTNYGHEDLQMQEAVNVIKDMIYLHNKNRQQQFSNAVVNQSQ